MSELFDGMRRARILIPDNTPLSLLAMLGPAALDWLFAPGAEVWVTDMVREEALRDPESDSDQRRVVRGDIADWFARNKHRIRIQATDGGENYRRSMANWVALGSPADTKPIWKNLGEISILQALEGVEKLVARGEAVLALVDDRRARAAIRAMTEVDIDLMATQSFIHWLAKRFHVKEAETAWIAIEIAANDRAPRAPDEDPVHIHKD